MCPDQNQKIGPHDITNEIPLLSLPARCLVMIQTMILTHGKKILNGLLRTKSHGQPTNTFKRYRTAGTGIRLRHPRPDSLIPLGTDLKLRGCQTSLAENTGTHIPTTQTPYTTHQPKLGSLTPKEYSSVSDAKYGELFYTHSTSQALGVEAQNGSTPSPK